MACPGADPGAASVIEPVSGSCSVAIVRISVDLPAPLGPRRPNIPRGISRSMSRRARTPLGYVLETPRMVRCIVPGKGEGEEHECFIGLPHRTGVADRGFRV